MFLFNVLFHKEMDLATSSLARIFKVPRPVRNSIFYILPIKIKPFQILNQPLIKFQMQIRFQLCLRGWFAGHDVNFCSDLPRRASEIQFSLALLQLSLALKNCMFYNISFKDKENMVLACESIFSLTSLDGRPRYLHTFSKVNLNY